MAAAPQPYGQPPAYGQAPAFGQAFAFWRRQQHTACPDCMRKEILMKTLIDIVPANLLWVFLVLPNAVLLCMTFAGGHSAKVHAAMREG